MRKLFLAALVVFSIAGSARAQWGGEPKGQETNWLYNVFYATITNVSSTTVDVAGLYIGGANASKTLGLNVIGHSWMIKPVGGNARFQIVQTTKTISGAAGSIAGFNSSYPEGLYSGGASSNTFNASLSTTNPIIALSGDYLSGSFADKILNPVFIISGLANSQTTYIWIEYGNQKVP